MSALSPETLAKLRGWVSSSLASLIEDDDAHEKEAREVCETILALLDGWEALLAAVPNCRVHADNDRSEWCSTCKSKKDALDTLRGAK